MKNVFCLVLALLNGGASAGWILCSAGTHGSVLSSLFRVCLIDAVNEQSKGQSLERKDKRSPSVSEK